MFSRSFDKRPIIEEAQKINVSSYFRLNHLYIKEKIMKAISRPDEIHVKIDKETRVFKLPAEVKNDPSLKNENYLKFIIEIMEIGFSINLKQEKRGEIEYTKPNNIKLTYTKSNLNKGFVIWFVCLYCLKKVRYLYIPSNSEVLACRNCHKLVYAKQNETKRSRILRELLD